MGIEPTIFRFEVGRLIHWATRPMLQLDILVLSITQNISLLLIAKCTIVCNVFLDLMSSLIHCSGWALLLSTIWTFRSNFLQNDRANVLAAMAEWLRRLTRNQMGSSRVGSNPTRSGAFFRVRCNKHRSYLKDVMVMTRNMNDNVKLTPLVKLNSFSNTHYVRCTGIPKYGLFREVTITGFEPTIFRFSRLH